jgi:hypothetical protein
MFDDLEHNDNEELEFGPELSDKEQGELWEMIYEKISLAVLNNLVFNTFIFCGLSLSEKFGAELS